MFRYVLIVFRLRCLGISGVAALSCMHIGTLQDMTKSVKTQNFGSEGWGFESLQARIV